MFRPRIIPVVLIDGRGHAIKTLKFKKRIDLGDPINTVSIFNAFKVDELVLLDIDAPNSRRCISLDLLADIASEARMPFSVGGGITSLDDIRSILSIGAEKVVISSAAIDRPEFIREAAEKFGSSSIIVCIDVKRSFFGNKEVYINSGKRNTKLNPLATALLMEKMGAGEILLQSIDHDGQMNGYDIQLISEVSSAVGIPVIALGGAKDLQSMMELYRSTYVSALAAGSLFVFQNSERGVLVNYPTKQDLNCFRDLR
jgi:cyclase